MTKTAENKPPVIEKVLPNLHRITMPLEGVTTSIVNSYLLGRGDDWLIIDTGTPNERAWQIMSSACQELGCDSKKAAYFITHGHWDHNGLLPKLIGPESMVYMSPLDFARLTGEPYWAPLTDYGKRVGFDDKAIVEIERMFKKIYGPLVKSTKGLTAAEHGGILEAAGFRFVCMATPGHTPGHMCLYEPEKKLLFTGDHLLKKAPPYIPMNTFELDSLGQYLDSLSLIEELEVDLVLPGHGRAFKGHGQVIKRFRIEIQRRLRSTLKLVENQRLTALQAAPLLDWRPAKPRWEELPTVRQWFGMMEALVYLWRLRCSGKAQWDGAGFLAA